MTASGYDGTIKIDTSINPKGFNDGMKNVTKSARYAFSWLWDEMVRDADLSMAKTQTAAAKALAGIAKSLSILAGVGAVTAAVVALVGAALVGIGLGIVALGVHLVNTMARAVDKTSEYGKLLTDVTTQFTNLKGAVYAAFAPLITLALPYIKAIIAWLTRVINYISMVIAAITGQTSVMQYVEGSAEAAAKSTDKVTTSTDNASKSTDKLAKSTKKAKDEAKGALAAFDQINVLQEKTAEAMDIQEPIIPEEIAAPQEPTTGSGMMFKKVDIPQEVIDKWAWLAELIDDIRRGDWGELFDDLWKNFLKLWNEKIWPWIVEKWNGFWSWIVEKWNAFWGWVGENARKGWDNITENARKAWDQIVAIWNTAKQNFQDEFLTPAGKSLQELWDTARKNAERFWNWLSSGEAWKDLEGTWNTIGTNLQNNMITPISESFGQLWTDAKTGAASAWKTITETQAYKNLQDNVLTPISESFGKLWEDIGKWAAGAWQGITDAWNGAGAWFQTTVIDPIKDAFKTALDWIKDKWETIFGGIQDFVKGTFNKIIDLLNAMINGVVSGINDIISGANTVGGILPGYAPIATLSAPQIPRLATGAVIPPNAAFAAILGDQKSGTNIETPVSLMRQVMEEALEARQGSSEITINFAGSLGALVRELKPYIDKENVRIGKTLVSGGYVS